MKLNIFNTFTNGGAWSSTVSPYPLVLPEQFILEYLADVFLDAASTRRKRGVVNQLVVLVESNE